MIKIDIISGFLGSGKTTFIKKLLSAYYKDKKVVLIENEYGEVGVDGLLFKNENIQVRELYSGCICCSLNTDFTKSLKEVIELFKPDTVIVEPSGVGKLSEVIQNCIPLVKQNLVSINHKFTIVDVMKYSVYLKNFKEFYDDQIKYCDAVLLSRVDVCDEIKVREVISSIQNKYHKKYIVSLEQNLLDETIVNYIMSTKSVVHSENDMHCNCHHNHVVHNADDVFSSWGIKLEKSYKYEYIKEILEQFNSGSFGNIIRAKGIFKCEDGLFYEFSFVPDEIKVIPYNYISSGCICVVGFKPNKEKLERAFV